MTRSPNSTAPTTSPLSCELCGRQLVERGDGLFDPCAACRPTARELAALIILTLGMFATVALVIAAVLYTIRRTAVSICVVAVLLATVTAAPTPPPVKLTEETIVARWRIVYQHGMCGHIWFSADHSYVISLNESEGRYLFHGTWQIRGGELEMSEMTTNLESRTNEGPTQAHYKIMGSNYPTVVLKARGVFVFDFTISDPKRD